MNDSQIQAEINALKSLLNHSDYILHKHVESLFLCSSLQEMQTVFENAREERQALIQKRQSWREQIGTLEQSLA